MKPLIMTSILLALALGLWLFNSAAERTVRDQREAERAAAQQRVIESFRTLAVMDCRRTTRENCARIWAGDPGEEIACTERGKDACDELTTEPPTRPATGH